MHDKIREMKIRVTELASGIGSIGYIASGCSYSMP